MKKTLSLFLFIVFGMLTLSLFVCPVSAAEENDGVYVTIAVDGLKLCAERVTLADEDGDGILSVNDALIGAHKSFCPEGKDGYLAVESAYGKSLVRLWNVESGFGYYVNHAPAMSLDDEIHGGDVVAAFAYTDTVAWSDVYTYFDKTEVEAEKGDSVTLSLVALGYDSSWNVVETPVEGAEILLDGKGTGLLTDENGQVTLSVKKGGEYIVSARGADDAAPLVPPVCRLTVEKTNTAFVWIAAGAVLILAGIGILLLGRKHEK